MGFSLGKALGGIVKSVIPGPGKLAIEALSGLKKSNKASKGGSASMGALTLAQQGTTVTKTQYGPAGMLGNTQTVTTTGGGGGQRGFHLNRSTYVTRGGGTSRWPNQLQLHPKGTVEVRNRKLNPGNGRAALHAVRRLVAFYRLSNRVAKQLRKAASRAHIGGRHGRSSFPRGAGQRFLPRGNVTVVE
jgi:hypothetical protein